MTPAEFKQARQKLGLTQSQMAHAIGLSRQATIADKEAGRQVITRQDVLLIAYLVAEARKD